jgi:5-hydroxyisourate hydrolase
MGSRARIAATVRGASASQVALKCRSPATIERSGRSAIDAAEDTRTNEGETERTTPGPEAPTISTHVLDTGRGRPAVGVRVSLYRRHGDEERLVGEGTTDADGRIKRLLTEDLVAGDYRIAFDLEDPSTPAPGDGPPFFAGLSVELRISDTRRSYHVPLLVAPYALTAYRGS